MTRHKKTLYLILPVLILTLAALACGTGYQTSSKISGNTGEVRIKMKEADGVDTTSVEINEDWTRARIGTTVTLAVETGSCQAYLTGEDGTNIYLDAAGGSPNQTYGDLVTDAFGEIDLQTDCQGVQNLDLLINFTRK
jgi:hypothetical protein